MRDRFQHSRAAVAPVHRPPRIGSRSDAKAGSPRDPDPSAARRRRSRRAPRPTAAPLGPPLRGGPAAPGSGSRGDPAFGQSHRRGLREGVRGTDSRAPRAAPRPPRIGSRSDAKAGSPRDPDPSAARRRRSRRAPRLLPPTAPLRHRPDAPGSGPRGGPAFKQSHRRGLREGVRGTDSRAHRATPRPPRIGSRSDAKAGSPRDPDPSAARRRRSRRSPRLLPPAPPLRGGPAAPGSGPRGDPASEQSHRRGLREGVRGTDSRAPRAPRAAPRPSRMGSRSDAKAGSPRDPDPSAARLRRSRRSPRLLPPAPPLRRRPAAPGSGPRGGPAFKQSHRRGLREGVRGTDSRAPRAAPRPSRIGSRSDAKAGSPRDPDPSAARRRRSRRAPRLLPPTAPLRHRPAAPGSGPRGGPAFTQSHRRGLREGEGPERTDAFRPAGGWAAGFLCGHNRPWPVMRNRFQHSRAAVAPMHRPRRHPCVVPLPQDPEKLRSPPARAPARPPATGATERNSVRPAPFLRDRP